MAQNSKPSMVGYHAAINWLYDNRPHMVEYITALGAPKNDLRCDRAMVVSGPDMKPRLYANDEFLQKIGPAQAAGVLVHEFRHVLLDHFSETRNPKSNWKYPIVVRDSQEATINDSIELTGYELPDDVIRGENRGGEFYGYWSTDEAYGPMEKWYLDQQQNSQDQDSQADQDQESGDDSGDQEADSSDQQAGSGSGSGSAGSGGEPQDGAEESDGSNSGAGTPSEDQQNGSDSGGSDPSDQEDSDSTESGTAAGGSESKDDGDVDSPSSDSNQSDSEPSEDGEESTESADGADGTSSTADGEEESDQEASGQDGADQAPDELDEHTSSDGCKHGAYIEDENGDLREMSDEELQDFVDKLNETLTEVIESNPMPDDEKPTEDELDGMDQDVAAAVDPTRNSSYSKAGHAASAAEQVLAGGKLHLGWLKLLQKINPDVGKDDGGMNAKASYNWARPRRTTSLIPGVHLPTPGAPRGIGAGAKQKPVALIALDFSGSIDRRLAYAMKDMAQSIPEEHIEARCFTFSTEAVAFDFRAKSNRVAGGGTDFSCLEHEARRIKQETGEYPFVICLTDGDAWFDGYGYQGAAQPSAVQLASHWLWVDVNTEDDAQAFVGYPADARVQAQNNKSALPYDRSKL